jgi:uncharacterized protein (DUF2336 family)
MDIRKSTASNSEAVGLKEAASNSEAAGPKKAAAPGGLDPKTALAILKMRAHEAQAYLAERRDVDGEVLNYLAEHGPAAVRQAVAANPATPAAANRLLADDEEEAVRAELAVKIGRLMPGLRHEENQRIVALTLQTLECLAQDSAPRVRAALAEEIKHLNCIPHAVALRLAHDLESIVAAPVLEYSPLLSDADLVEIIACAKVQESLAAIARRSPLSENVADVLVQALDVPGVAGLLVNPDARIRQQTMDRIIEQAEEIESWQMPLVLRADLSTRAIQRIAGFVGAALIELLGQRGNLDEPTRALLGQRLRARLKEQKPQDPASPEAAAAEIAKAKSAGRLDEAFVEDALFAGRRETVIQALAALAKVPDAQARKVLTSGKPKPVVALVWHAGLSMRVAFKIQGVLMKLPANQILPARGGVHFPLSEEEMRFQLSVFDIQL